MSDKPLLRLPVVTGVVAIVDGDLGESRLASYGNLQVMLDTQGENHLLFSLTPEAAAALKATLETLLQFPNSRSVSGSSSPSTRH